MEGGGVAPDRVYLDYAGFSPVDPRVLNVMRPFLEAGIGNPSAPHSLGFEARESLEEVINARPNFVDAEAALGLAHYLSGDGVGARDVWKACLARRPENARVEAYLAMLGRTGA